MKKLFITLLKIGISAAILGYLFWKAQQHEAFTNLAKHPKNWFMLSAAAAVCGSAVVITLVRWYYLVRALGLSFPLHDALRLGLLGYLFNLAPMGIVGGDLLKAFLLARHQGGHRPRALASVFVDRAVGLYMLFVVASVAILLTRFHAIDSLAWVCRATITVTLVATVGIVAVLLPDFSQGRSTRWIARIPSAGPPLLRLIDAIQMYRRRLGALALAAILSVAVHSLFTVGIFLIASGLYGERVHSLGRHFVLCPLSAATQVIPIPAGHVEASLDWLYAQVDLPDPLPGNPSGVANDSPIASADPSRKVSQGSLKSSEGLMVALGYRIITMLIAAVGVCYYLGSREEVAEVFHDAQEQSDDQLDDQDDDQLDDQDEDQIEGPA